MSTATLVPGTEWARQENGSGGVGATAPLSLPNSLDGVAVAVTEPATERRSGRFVAGDVSRLPKLFFDAHRQRIAEFLAVRRGPSTQRGSF